MEREAGHTVDGWIEALGPERAREAEELAKLVRSADERIEQAVKWGRLTFTVEGNWHHWLCGVAVTRKGTKLVLHKGALLEDPDGVLDGDGRYLRELPLDRALARPDATRAVIRSAIAHQTEM